MYRVIVVSKGDPLGGKACIFLLLDFIEPFLGVGE